MNSLLIRFKNEFETKHKEILREKLKTGLQALGLY